MKYRMFFLTAFLLNFYLIAVAQVTSKYGDSTAYRRAAMEASAITGDLQLSSDQQQSLVKVLDTFYSKMQLLNDRYGGKTSSSPLKRDEMRMVYMNREKGIQLVLNEIQWARYLSGMNERRHRVLADTALSRSINTHIMHQ